MSRDRTKELMTNGLSPIQVEALAIVQKWVETKKTVCPKGEIFKALIIKDYGESAIRKAIAALVREGYIRRSVSSGNRTFFVLQKWL